MFQRLGAVGAARGFQVVFMRVPGAGADADAGCLPSWPFQA